MCPRSLPHQVVHLDPLYHLGQDEVLPHLLGGIEIRIFSSMYGDGDCVFSRASERMCFSSGTVPRGWNGMFLRTHCTGRCGSRWERQGRPNTVHPPEDTDGKDDAEDGRELQRLGRAADNAKAQCHCTACGQQGSGKPGGSSRDGRAHSINVTNEVFELAMVPTGPLLAIMFTACSRRVVGSAWLPWYVDDVKDCNGGGAKAKAYALILTSSSMRRSSSYPQVIHAQHTASMMPSMVSMMPLKDHSSVSSKSCAP